MTTTSSSLSSSRSESQLNFSGRLYHLSTCRSSPRFSLGGKATGQKPSPNPGPGAYEPPSPLGASSPRYRGSPNYAFAHSPRDPPQPSTTLGPGVYEVCEPGRILETHAFTRSPRALPVAPPTEWVPGPGTYPSRQLWGVEGLKPVLAARLESEGRRPNYPGPGTYAVRVEKEIRQAKCGFGSNSPRDPSPRSSSPGPGAYTITNQASGPRFTMSSGREHKRAPPPRLTAVRAG